MAVLDQPQMTTWPAADPPVRVGLTKVTSRVLALKAKFDGQPRPWGVIDPGHFALGAVEPDVGLGPFDDGRHGLRYGIAQPRPNPRLIGQMLGVNGGWDEGGHSLNPCVTFVRASIISIYFGFNSHRIALRPSSMATMPVVPLPPNGSRMVSPKLLPARMARRGISVGNVAK